MLAILATVQAASAGERYPIAQKGAAATEPGTVFPSRVYTRAQVSSGGVSLKNLRGGAIHITASVKPDGVFVQVEDNGPGILPEVRGKLFEPFGGFQFAGRRAAQAFEFADAIGIQTDVAPGGNRVGR